MPLSWWHPASKNLLRLEAGYPALRCHILNNQQVTRHTHTAHTTKTKTTQNSKTAKHSHTHKTHTETPHLTQRLERIPPGF